MSVASILIGYLALIFLCGPVGVLLIVAHIAIMIHAVNRKAP